ncbi:ferritin family protein [Thermococcus sp. JdF3]|uniref:ferritin-like domain-containing protein n=1 Tax=Thermococcus sp. JdF3 TaxID=1638258 RepID=UPI00143C660B|nr:ferritin family protein [Thermococcus sp. JdF3]
MVTKMAIDVGIIQDVEILLKNLNGYELLSYAICNEKCGAESYEWLARRVEGMLADEFLQLAGEKRKHAVQMMGLFERLYPGMRPLEFNAPPLDTLPVCDEMMGVGDVENALALALISEAIGRDIYRKLQRMAGDEEVAALFGELAAIKENAYERLLRLYGELTSSPQWGEIPLRRWQNTF